MVTWLRNRRDCLSRDGARESKSNQIIAAIEASPARTLAVILLLAICLTLPRLWLMPLSLTNGDSATWWPVIDNVAHGRGYTECIPSYFPYCGPTNNISAAREPASVLLFAAVDRVTHASASAAVLVQIALNLIVVLGVYSLARQLAGVRIGLFAALLWVLSIPVAKSEVAEVSGDMLATACVAWGLFFFMRARARNRASDYLAAGLCLSLGILSRSVLALIPVLLIIGLVAGAFVARRVQPRRLGRLLTPIALFALASFVPFSPWFVRNYIEFHQPVLGTTLNGYNLYRENYQLSQSSYLRYVGGDEADRAVAALVARRTDLNGTVNEAQMDGVYRTEALKSIKAAPLRYVILSAARGVMLWFNWTIPAGYGLSWTALD
ncbi:MAG: glycosyltransferase family 39 protein, partial [Thermomicrobia bacterium]|nr:glycosyltransferase family 39 protein [Thermomicrobia bacterium]